MLPYNVMATLGRLPTHRLTLPPVKITIREAWWLGASKCFENKNLARFGQATASTRNWPVALAARLVPPALFCSFGFLLEDRDS